jgi:UDP-glucose 4-epimerase
MKVLVTGCAGFIGSNLTDRLLSLGYEVIGLDNLSTGQNRFLTDAKSYPNFKFHHVDLLTNRGLEKYFHNIDLVFHFSANADVRYGVENTRRDLEQNTLVTFNVLEAMRIAGCKKIAFSSTGSIYGDSSKNSPTSEDSPFPVQTSLYGASKLACEGLITAYCEAFKFTSWIYRFVSILGERYTHGHVFDFYRQLLDHPEYLKVLGNGRQRKSYLYIGDCIDAILLTIQNTQNHVNIFNLGLDSHIEVLESVEIICKALNLNPRIECSGGDRGWIGDNPFIYLDTKKIIEFGWKPALTIEEGILRTLLYLKDNQWIFEARS